MAGQGTLHKGDELGGAKSAMTQGGWHFCYKVASLECSLLVLREKKSLTSENIVIVYCTASWMPHMRIALSNTLLSVSDYAASLYCTLVEPAVDRELA